MAAQLEASAPPRVALLGRDDDVRAQLRAALSEAGAEIVHEGDPREVAAEALLGAAAGTVIVNLDAGLEDAIEHLDALFDAPGVQVVFNESEVTQRLSGWDLSRWARHLVAKVLGHGDATPPPPPGSESLPLRDLQPEPRRPGMQPVEPDHSALDAQIDEEVRLSVEVVPASRLPQDQEALPAIEEVVIDIELEDAEPELDFDIPSVAIEKPTSDSASAAYLDKDEVLEIDDFELVPHDELPGAPRTLGPDEPTVVLSRDELHRQLAVEAGEAVEDLLTPRRGNDAPTVVLERADLEASLEALEQDSIELDVAPASAAYVDPADDETLSIDPVEIEGLLDFDDEATLQSLSSTHDEEEVDLGLDADVAALAAQLDALAEETPGGRVDEFDGPRDFDELSMDLDVETGTDTEPASLGSPQAARGDAAPSSPPARAGFGELSLADLDAEPAPAAAATEPVGSSFDFDSLKFSLAPLEGEEAPPGTIARVVVLGASIGGPDALRSFLGAIPAEFPAVFVLVQHLENGFFERLAQQLQKASALQVRVAADGAEPARMGEVLVLPSDARYSVARDGRIEREEYAEPPRYKPCIDDAFRAAADAFGRDTLAIIFSGMAGDAVEGASHVTAMGGQVWGQDPESCVVSSMIDGANARGLLEVIASPRELAEQLVARFGRR